MGKSCRKFGYNFCGLGARGVHSSDNGALPIFQTGIEGYKKMDVEGIKEGGLGNRTLGRGCRSGRPERLTWRKASETILSDFKGIRDEQ